LSGLAEAVYMAVMLFAVVVMCRAMNSPTPWSTVIVEKLTVALLVKKYLAF
jgi:hypothetical protein